MNKPLKWLLGTLAALVLLIVLAAVLVPLLFDAEDLKRTIEAEGSKATGRELRINGDLAFSVFPWLAAEAGDVTLANAPGFGDEPFARIAEARIGVALLPLLRRELVVDEVRLDGLQLDLQVNAQGASNWDDLIQPQTAGPGGGGGNAFASPSVAGLDLRDAVIQYRDAQADSHWILSELDLKTGALGRGLPVAVTLQTRVEDRIAPRSMRLDSSAELIIDLQRQQYDFSGLQLEAVLESDGGDLRLQAPTLNADLAAQTAVFSDLDLSVAFADGATQAEITTPRLAAQLDEQRFTAEALGVTAQLDGGKTHGRIDAARLDAELERQRFVFTQVAAVLNLDGQAEPLPLEAGRADLDLSGGGALVLDRFTARWAGTDVAGSLTAEDVLGSPRARGNLALPSFEPRAMLAALGQDVPETTDPKVLGHGSLETDFDGSLEQLSLTNLQLGLDESRISGALSWPDLTTGALRFDLDIDTIDLDRYLPPARETAARQPGIPAALPRDAVRGHDLQGSLRVGKLRLLGLDLAQAEMGVNAGDNRVRLNPLIANAFGGSYSGDITLDASGDVLVVDAQHEFESLGLQELGRTFAGFDDLSGMLVGQLVTNGRGADSQQLLNSLSGSLALDVEDGALEGVNLWHEVRKAYAKYKGRPAPEPEPNRTPFSRLSLEGPIRDGAIELRELIGEVQVLSLTGGGAVRLAQGELDLGVTARVREVPEVLEDPLVASLAGKRLPLRISGPFNSPGVSVDFAELLKSEAADALLRKLSKDPQRDPDAPVSEEEQLKDTARGLLRDLLRDKEPTADEGGD